MTDRMPTLETRVTSNWRLAKPFRTRWAAYEAANLFVDRYPLQSISVEWEPRCGAYVVEVFGPRAGARRWLIY